MDRVKLVDATSDQAQPEVSIHVGRNRVVRRLMEEVGHPVRRLMRLQFGPVKLGRLRPGGVRVLTRHEVGALLDSVDLST